MRFILEDAVHLVSPRFPVSAGRSHLCLRLLQQALSLSLVPSTHLLSCSVTYTHKCTSGLLQGCKPWPLVIYAICLRSYGQLSDKLPQTHKDNTATWANMRGNINPRCPTPWVYVCFLTSFPEQPVHNNPLNQLSNQSGDLANPQHKHVKKPTEGVCVCVCCPQERAVWWCV